MKKSFLPRTSTRLSAGSTAARASAASCCSRPWASTSTRIPSSPATCPTPLTGSRTENSTALTRGRSTPRPPRPHRLWLLFALHRQGPEQRSGARGRSRQVRSRGRERQDGGRALLLYRRRDAGGVLGDAGFPARAGKARPLAAGRWHRLCVEVQRTLPAAGGYDDENYWFNDPWHDHGVCPQPKQLVEDCHAAQGLFAVTLRPKGEV